jgi:hypothetical protein
LPVVIARLAGKIFHKKGSTNDGLKSDFEKFNNNLASKIFYKIFSIEDLLIKRKIKLFPGVSIVGVYEKRG